MEANETLPGTRLLPTWGWVAAVLFYPPGVFVALGAARLLTWQRAILLALASYASMAGFAVLMMQLEQRAVEKLFVNLALFAGLAVISVWSYVAYRIGRRAGYWSPGAIRLWVLAKRILIFLACLNCVGTGLFLWIRIRSGS